MQIEDTVRKNSNTTAPTARALLGIEPNVHIELFLTLLKAEMTVSHNDRGAKRSECRKKQVVNNSPRCESCMYVQYLFYFYI